MQKFEEGMRLISEASELCGLSLTSRIMQPNAFGLPSSLDRTIEEGVRKLTVKRGKGSLKKQVWTGTGTISKRSL